MNPAAASPSVCAPSRSGRALSEAIEKAWAGERLQRRDAEALIRCPDLNLLGELATAARFRMNPLPRVTYIVDRNINPTNVCVARCRFCAFDRLPGDPEGYVLSKEEIFTKVDELLQVGGIQVLLQGGHHPELGIEYYEDLFRSLRERYPSLHIHGLSPSEIVHVSRLSRLSIPVVIERLEAAGLNSIPGGGGEILVDSVRQRIAPGKAMSGPWLTVMREAHRRGMRTTATMMYGHVETLDDRVEHLLLLRDLQDQTRGFTAFIAWPFQPGGSELDLPRSGAQEFLRINAVARLVLDNFDHQQTSFVTQGDKLGQLALFFGCDDFGGTMLEENVVSAAGTQCLIPIERIEHCIRSAGFEPRRRNMYYEVLQ